MNKVVVFGDSTLDLSPELYEKYDIKIIPLLVRCKEDEFLDSITINGDQVYDFVKNSGVLPQTSAQGPDYIISRFKEYLDKGYDIVYTGIGSKLSSCYNSVMIAKRELDENRIFAIDSCNLSTGSAIMAIKCCELRDKGLSAKEIFATLKNKGQKIHSQFAVETLDYLHKGGRCSSVSLFVGQLFHIHPLLQVRDGLLICYKKVRGRMEKAIDEQIDFLKQFYHKIDKSVVFITTAGANQSIIDYAKNKLLDLFEEKSILITRAGAVISSHCGYGTIGILFMEK